MPMRSVPGPCATDGAVAERLRISATVAHGRLRAPHPAPVDQRTDVLAPIAYLRPVSSRILSLSSSTGRLALRWCRKPQTPMAIAMMRMSAV